MILPILSIIDSPSRGRGVFANAAIAAGTTIEIAPVIVLNPAERKKVEETLLYNYVFEWGEDNKSAIIALGYASIYNHSKLANCKYEMDFDYLTITIITLKAIGQGEELLINYNGEGGADPDWFEVH
jgi:SET domain-containing protein